MVDVNRSISKTNLFLAIFLIIIIFITVLSALNPDFGNFFSLNNWFDQDALNLVPIWAAFGFVMLVCFLGALVPVPIPYAIPVSIFSTIWLELYGTAAWGLIIFLVGFAAFSNTGGDLVDYYVGRGTEYVLSKEDPELQDRWSEIILKRPRAIPAVIFLFGLTPLPDSLLMVPLGIVQYDKKKVVLWMFSSRFCQFLFFYAMAGAFALDWLLMTSESSEIGWIYGVILLYIIWGIIFLMVKVKPKSE